ncbi:iron complex transport system substrate-binding protein [Paramicrobacterium humi]|uniref:Iron complex transport system substrate-binding protein n=1 Tax=Paramicrobacterium humi TaxID=640635 RepID=A0A1H4P9C7_9MICO|nr:iron-siderophore ABC transporter substrate-binding protein [Microbacterium humi]SEC03935.1 iron complex transport system substrate-binding protein [Microbacterium humi]
MPSPRRILAGTLALAAAVALSGCSAPAASDVPAESASSAFPVTIRSSLGDATVAAQPERVLTLGQGTADTVVALGITPVAVEADAWGGDADGYQPWVREAIEERGDALPALIAGGTEIDMDAVVAADPDLILAPQSGLTQDQFDVLSKLAPTVAYPGQAWSTPWDEQIEIIGTALGKPEEADALISGITDTLGDVAEAHPEWRDTSFAYVYTSSPGVLGVFQPSEPRAAILELMGLRTAAFVTEQPVDEGTASSTLSLENADLLDDTDLVFSWFENAENQAQIEAQPLYAQIPAVQRGSDVVIYDHQFVTAASLITPLTVPWVIDDYVELIEKAVERL